MGERGEEEEEEEEREGSYQEGRWSINTWPGETLRICGGTPLGR